MPMQPDISVSEKKIEEKKQEKSENNVQKFSELCPDQSFLEKDEVCEEIKIQEKEGTDSYYLNYIMMAIGLSIIGICALFGFSSNTRNIFFNVMLLIGSLCLLLGASDMVLEFSVKIAHALGISEIVIGLTIVSLGTSIPEMFTAIASAKEGIGAFVVGDVYGSYITQLSLFLGLVVLVDPETVSKEYVPHAKRDGLLMLGALLFLSFNISDGHLYRYEAYIGLSIYIIYVLYLYISAKRNPEVAKESLKIEEEMSEMERVFTKDQLAEHHIKGLENNPEATEVEKALAIALKKETKPKTWLMLIYVLLVFIGAFACYIGATNVVFSGSNLAYVANIPTHVVAATIVGFGTGFPEFVVSVMAIRRKKLDIAYGNLLGSNIVDPCVSISLGVLTQEIHMTSAETLGILGGILPIAIILDIFIIISFNHKRSSKKRGLLTGILLFCFYIFFLVSSFFSK